MKARFFFFIAVCFVASLEPVISQKFVPNSAITGVCYAGNKTTRIYIPPPDEFYKKSGRKGGASITLLSSGFPNTALTAVKFAVSILESILPPDTKMTLSASWETITTSGVLANSSTTGYSEGFAVNALNPKVFYPIALAEKIGGESLNDSLTPDVTLRVNRSINWYMGTDGHTAAGKYDLVTVILHEVCHGLGFFDSMDASATAGSYGIGSVPLIYDTFIENLQGEKLTDSLIFRNPSSDLRVQLTGKNLYFNGPLLRTYTSGSRAPIYAPSVFDPGSSISHLDEDKTLAPNTLMTPFIDMGEAIHDPGQYTLSILGDLGWINTRIIHNARHDTENHLSELPLSIRIASDTLYYHDTVGIVYSFDNFVSYDTLIMTSAGSDDNYNCTISIPSYNRGVKYYFFVEDWFGRIYRSPSLIDSMRYSVYIGTDTVKPVISHTPVTSVLEKVDTITINAVVTDNLGVDTVYAEYKLNNNESVFIGLKPGEKNRYSAELIASLLLLNGGDSIQYRIVARDSAMVPNVSILPHTGYFTIHVEDLRPVSDSYATDFADTTTNDFINDGFRIYKPAGFTHSGLNSKHPYESPEDNTKTIEYTSILRQPLKFRESGIVLNFNEIVLVEPGETGSVFGSDLFYDYVIVEGSKNWGKKWFKLADGYDSRFFKTWETAYDNLINSDGNSLTAGTESMLHKHSIYFAPSPEASPGDTLLVRFRLFSDPFSNGWGWIIEDLKIAPLVDAVEKVNSGEQVIAYPNPGNGLIRISTGQDLNQNAKPVRYFIYTTSGICVKSDFLTGEAESVIDISDRPAGLYIIILSGNDGLKTIKYSLIK